MKLIEALKSLKILEKRVQTNYTRIGAYSSKASFEKSPFGSEVKQRQEVDSLIQANHDLLKEYMVLKQALEYSNLQIKVTIDQKEYTISELLMFKRFGCSWMISTYNSLTPGAAQKTMSGPRPTDEDRATIDYMYDEAEKNRQREKWQSLYSQIDSTLEIVNATTDLIF